MCRRRVAWVAVAVAALGAGCGRPAEVPRFDLADAPGYRPAVLKDVAPANARVESSAFPQEFTDADGNPVDLRKYRGVRKVVLVVLRGVPREFRGDFCPTCLAQAGSLTANRQEFARRGVEVLVVFPGPAERLGEFLQRVRGQVPGEPDRAFRPLLDRECAACDRLGIRDDLAKPSTYVIDTRGNVVYAYVGETSTDRPSVKAILAQLDEAD